MGAKYGFGGTLCFVIVVVIIVLIAMSFKRVETNTAAVSYNTVTRNLGDEVLEPGVKTVGPSTILIAFQTTQQRATARNVPALSRDSIRIVLDVQVLYTIQKEKIVDIMDKYYDEPGHESFINEYVTGIARQVASTFSAKQFYLERTTFQTELLRIVTQRFASDDIAHVTVDSVQVLAIDLPRDVLSVMEASTVAEQDITNARSESNTQIQAALIALDRAQSEASLVLIDAARDVAVIEQATLQAIVVEREKMATRSDAFGNISQGLGLGGDFFVQSYLKSLVLQNNEGQSVVGV